MPENFNSELREKKLDHQESQQRKSKDDELSRNDLATNLDLDLDLEKGEVEVETQRSRTATIRATPHTVTHTHAQADAEAINHVNGDGNANNGNSKEGPEGTVLVREVEDVEEPSLDPRLNLDEPEKLAERPRNEELDEGFVKRFEKFASGVGKENGRGRKKGRGSPGREKVGEVEVVEVGSEEVVYIQFEEGDKRNPVNFPRSKKWAITYLSCFSTLIASSTGSIYNSGFESMTRDLNCTDFQATIGLSLYALGFGIVPLVTASFSEEVGRQPLYIVSATGVLLMYVMIALAHNIQTVLVARFIQGAFGSTWATMVGGTISDIWTPAERGLPMSLFTLAAIGGTGLGPVYAGWIEMDKRLEWRWIEWIEMMLCALYLIFVPFIMRETRSSILLIKLAKKIRKETGDNRYRARAEDEHTSLWRLIYVACTRPIHLLLSEPVVASFSLWVGFAWGLVYGMIESISQVFSEVHGFSVGQIGTVFLAMVIGSLLGFGTNFIQERLYQKYYSNRGPEARLYLAMCAGVLFPVGMFIYAWSTFSFVPWIALAIGIAVFTHATFIIYLAVFTYLADCYGPFASSALAGQSLCRNVSATAFPLFTTQMFQRLTFKWANTLFACIACIMMPIPFILFFYGPRIRAKSKFSRIVMQQQQK